MKNVVKSDHTHGKTEGMPASKHAIGLDIGATKIACGIVREDGYIASYTVVPTPGEGRRGIIKILPHLVFDLKGKASEFGIKNLMGIGVGTAGQIDYRNGKVLSGTTTISDWNDVPLRDLLEDASHLPVYVDNDVNVFTLAECKFGAALGSMEAVCLTLGTGVGGGVLTNGNLLRGAFGGAGELGHVSVHMDGPTCNCGLRGCLELYASGTGLAREMQTRLAAEHQTVPASGSTKGDVPLSSVTSEDVFRWFKEEEPLAVSVIETMLRALSTGVVSFIHAFNPTVVVLGGGLLSHAPWIADEVRTRIRKMGIQSMVSSVQILPALFGAEAGLVGAATQCFVTE